MMESLVQAPVKKTFEKHLTYYAIVMYLVYTFVSAWTSLIRYLAEHKHLHR